MAAPALDEWRKREATVGWVGVDEELVGVFCVGDEVRPEAAKAVVDLKVILYSVARDIFAADAPLEFALRSFVNSQGSLRSLED